MIIVTIPQNNLMEREYIIGIILGEFLGLDYKTIEDHNCKNWNIELENGNRLIFEDHFFNRYTEDKEYLQEKNIPQKVSFCNNKFTREDDIPVLFGNANIEQNSHKIICGIDIFASSFFMLTRWEEYVNETRDEHNRFVAMHSLGYKNNFLHRAIVNEYVQMLKNMLLSLDVNMFFKQERKQLFITHDVDHLYQWRSWRHVARVALGDIIKRKSFGLALEKIKGYYAIKKGEQKDPYDTFDYLMDKSELMGVKSRFYFMSGGITQYDNRYKIGEPKALELIEKIKKRGHSIGIHPSYNAYNNRKQFKIEKERLEEVTAIKIVESRAHYLRFEVPTTWQIFEEEGIKVDSTCGYADKIGFRCGTGDEFSVFNILTRQQLKLKERPLVVMDCSMFDYNNYSYSKAKAKIVTMQAYTNFFTFLWHNSYTKHMHFYGELFENSGFNSFKQL